jgi:beta-galactosidase
LDRTGTVRPIGYQRASWWSDKPMVYIARRVAPTPLAPTDPGYSPIPDRRPQVLFSDWTPRNRDAHKENVEVYSNCDEVELFLNGVSQGAQSRPADDSPRIWRVQYAPGTLLAVGRNYGVAGNGPQGVAVLGPQASSPADSTYQNRSSSFQKSQSSLPANSKNKTRVVATYELRTAGAPAKIILTPDRNSVGPTWDDAVYVKATVVDAKGILIPTAADLITFKLTGPGVIAAVDSGNNASHEPFPASERKAYQGRCFAMIKASGTKGRITLSASALGLKGSSISILVRK